jgi:outer membrane receptor protein involved in Fe transport
VTKIKTTAYRAGAAGFALAVASLAAPAFAQDTAAPADVADAAAPEGQAIVVTGSRIARPELESPVPVAVVSNEKLGSTGATNIQDQLAQLPSVGQNVSRSSSNFSNSNNGVATLNLRNLGSARTLVLINGRRTVGLPGTSSTDLNNIPAELVDHVEVITGGASAVYGSEAISGVVNFVLKRNFEGLAIHGQGTLSDKGDAPRQYISGLAGFNFGDGNGNITFSGSYDNDHGLRSRNREFSAHDDPNRSSYAAQGLFSLDGNFSPANGQTFTFDQNNNVKPYQGANIDGYDRNQQRYLSLPVRRYIGSVLGHYDFGSADLYFEGTYAKTKSNASLEALAIANTGPGAALNFDETPYAGIPITSPFVPQAIRDAAIAAGTDVIQFRRRSVDIFSRSNRNDRDFWRGVVGVKGDFSPKWHYDVYYEHSQSRDHTQAGAIYAPNYGAALSNELVDGQVVCSDPVARAAGCVPLNIFGYNTVTPAAAKFLQTYTGPSRTVALNDGSGGSVNLVNGAPVTYDYLAKVYQDVVSAQVSGELFSLWAKPWSLAAGAEYRRERSREVFDPFTQLGLSSGNQISNTIGSIGVKEAFAELVAPIAADRPGIKYFGLGAAARYADYTTSGGVWSYKVDAQYAPISDIRFNVGYARATRAPNIGELFSAISQTFPAITDPCDRGGGKGDGATLGPLPAKCASIPGISATNAAGGFAYTTSQIQTIDGLTGGNRALKPEKADTFTAGVVITPAAIRNFSLKVDYYRIKVKDAIGIIGQQVSVSQCFISGDPLFCNNVIRNSAGYITRVNGINLNTGSYLVEGLDTQFDYRTRADFLGEGGALAANVFWNHSFAQEQTPFPGGPVQNELGQADCYSCGRLGSGFRDKVNATFIGGNNKFNLSWTINYLGPLVDNLEDGADATRISAYWYHAAQLKFFVGPEKKYDFYLGVNNIFDKLPPKFGDTNQVTFPGTQTVANTYDLYGRMLYAGFNARF